MERGDDDGNFGYRRVLCDLVDFELRQFNRIVKCIKDGHGKLQTEFG